jgi:Reverse transcriptase (RNA-dependent DNA polymerase)/Endonuclease-reverse transcriptase
MVRMGGPSTTRLQCTTARWPACALRPRKEKRKVDEDEVQVVGVKVKVKVKVKPKVKVQVQGTDIDKDEVEVEIKKSKVEEKVQIVEVQNEESTEVLVLGDAPFQETQAPNARRPALDEGIELVYGNMSGLRNKIDEMVEAVADGTLKGTIIGIGETRLRAGDDMDIIDGYAWTGRCNGDVAALRANGGIGVWVKDGLNITVLPGDGDRRIWCRIPGATTAKARPCEDTYVCMCYAPLHDTNGERLQRQRRRSLEAEHKEEEAVEEDDEDEKESEEAGGAAQEERRTEAMVFWDEIRLEVLQYQTRGTVVIMGDLNARVGTIVGDTLVSPNGRRMLAFLRDCGMAMVNGTEKCSGGPWTWQRDELHTVLDYALVEEDDVDRVQSMVIADDDNFGSDHRRLHLHLQRKVHTPAPKVSTEQGHRRWRYVWRIPKDRSEWRTMATEFTARTDPWLARWTALLHDNKHPSKQVRIALANEIWEGWRTALDEAMLHTTGKRKAWSGNREPKRPPRDAAINALIQQRRVLWKELHQHQHAPSPHAKEAWKTYLQARRRVSHAVSNRKRAIEAKVLNEMEGLRDKNDAKFWELIRGRRSDRPSQAVPTRMTKKDGDETTSHAEVLAVFRDHFRTIGKADDDDEQFDGDFYEEIERTTTAMREDEGHTEGAEHLHLHLDFNTDITMKEVLTAIKQLQPGKAAGPDGLHNEMVINGGRSMAPSLHLLFTLLFRWQTVPDEWLKATITPLFKHVGAKGKERREASNYRGIALMSVIFKMYEFIHMRRLTTQLEGTGQVPEEQGGFRKGRSTIDQLFILTEAVAQRREDGLHTFVCLLDLTKAYDLTWRAGIWDKLTNAGVHGRLWHTITDMYREVRSCVAMDGTRSKWFRSKRGVRQGSVLSPVLFSLFINGLVKWLMDRGFGVAIGGKRMRGTRTPVGSRRLALLLFADDIALLASSEDELRKMLAAVEAYAHKWRTSFNGEKCEVMETATKRAVGEESDGDREPWTIDGAPMKDTDHVRYLGVDLQRNGKWDHHMERLTAKASTRLRQLWRVGSSCRGLRTRTAKHLAELFIRSVLEYGSEVIWPTKANQEEAERVMLNAARIITGAEMGTLSDALRAELGWRSMAEMRQLRQLAYFQRLRTLPPTHLAPWLFRQRMAHTAERIPGGDSKRNVGGGPTMGFCERLRLLMVRHGIADEWQPTTTHDATSWKQLVTKVEKCMNEEWQKRLATRTKGKIYGALKTTWGYESYLDDPGNGTRRRGGLLKLQMRCYSVELNAVRWCEHRAGVLSPVCGVCATGEDESLVHFMLRCPRYDDLRLPMVLVASTTVNEHFRSVQRGNNGNDGNDGGGGGRGDGGGSGGGEGGVPVRHWAAMNDDERLALLLTEGGRVDGEVKAFLTAAFARRKQAVAT